MRGATSWLNLGVAGNAPAGKSGAKVKLKGNFRMAELKMKFNFNSTQSRPTGEFRL
jgi:hypothetical protein